MAEQELQRHVAKTPRASDWLVGIATNQEDLLTKVDELLTTDPLRLAALNPRELSRVLHSKAKDIHRRVLVRFKPVLEMTMIRRSAASFLPVEVGEPIPLRGLFKKKIRKTARIERRLEEEVEYQLFHRQAAK
jgi:hypothetical protein